MTRQEADAYLNQYRNLVKAWTMAVGGFSSGDSDELYQQLQNGQEQLTRIARDFPDTGYAVDMLINSRSRSWAGFISERLPRPEMHRN